MTHTFMLVTNPDGTISHTYSWGNDANLHGWNLDQVLDRETGLNALELGIGLKVGDHKARELVLVPQMQGRSEEAHRDCEAARVVRRFVPALAMEGYL